MKIQDIKNRFGIVGNSPLLERAIDVAMQVSPTDLTVLITGESGTGKEVFPKIIHFLSARKHGPYIAVNCGAIPEGTIDSELFGHEKGAFTGAHEARKGYFEVAHLGTIFLDEVSELPLSTQVRLLRVLETGEFIRVGSSKVQKTDVRIVAASNVNLPEVVECGRFREDLYYRLNTVPVFIPPLRKRQEDIHLFFRKFTADFAEKYRMPPVRLEEDAVKALENYRWPGNVRQLKNITEQLSVIEQNRNISAETLNRYLPGHGLNNLPVLYRNPKQSGQDAGLTERDLMYRYMADMRKDISFLKDLMARILNRREPFSGAEDARVVKVYKDSDDVKYPGSTTEEEHFNLPEQEAVQPEITTAETAPVKTTAGEEAGESLSLQQQEMALIRKALIKHKSNREAAEELGISERTLYRKIKDYNIREDKVKGQKD